MAGRKRGRKKTVTDSAKKRQKKEYDRGQLRIRLGTEVDRWTAAIEETSATSHAELARILLDAWYGVEKMDMNRSRDASIEESTNSCSESESYNISYERLARVGAAPMLDWKRKNIPEELKNYLFFCKACGSDNIEVTPRVDEVPQQHTSVGEVRVKQEIVEEELDEDDDDGIQGTENDENNISLVEPRPTNLVCNVSVTKDTKTVSREVDVIVQQNKQENADDNNKQKNADDNNKQKNADDNNKQKNTDDNNKQKNTDDNNKQKNTDDKIIDYDEMPAADEGINDTDNGSVTESAPTETEKPKKKKKRKKVKESREKSDRNKSKELDDKQESDDDSGRRRSTRLKGKNRISFTKMVELDISDVDFEDSEDDSEEDEDDSCEDDEDFDSETDSNYCYPGKKKEKRILNKNVDPDFDPETSDDENIWEEEDDELNEEEDHDDDESPENVKKGQKRKFRFNKGDLDDFLNRKKPKLTAKEKEAKRRGNERKMERRRQLKELRAIYMGSVKKCESMSVKLEEHEDKYEMTMFTSICQKDRKVDLEQKSYYRYTCKVCDGQYNATDKAIMESHIKLHVQGLLTCVDCGVTFSKPLKLFNHRVDKHIEKFYTCEFCAEQFYALRSLQGHLAKQHNQKPFKCPKCLEHFSCLNDKKKHVIEEHSELAAQCEKCGEFFFGPDRLQTHINGKKCKAKLPSTDGNKVPCEVCGKVVVRTSMTKHMETVHLKIHSHKCELCPFTTGSAQSIRNHRMRHTGEHPYKCKLCDFSCVQDYQLKSHMRTHTGEKPYKCKECSFASAWNVQLKAHVKAHQSATRCTCDICNITFKHDRALNLHTKKHHSHETSNANKKLSGSDKKTVVKSDVNVNEKLTPNVIVIRTSYDQTKTVQDGVQDVGQLDPTPATQPMSGPSKGENHSSEQLQAIQQIAVDSDSKVVKYVTDQPIPEDQLEYVEYESEPAEYIVHITCQPDYTPAEQVVTTTNDV
ncbi:uncharacterized protein [Argopecten irradians]|uniref:uncharacterized protein isoform X3 n=1 Tax=Argopecten irradians TaxID=31199 RepID=UPI003715569D